MAAKPNGRMQQAAKMDWKYLYTDIDGRISRQTFWLGFFQLLAAEILVHFITQNIQGDRLSAIADLAFAYPEFALFAKRAQDRGNDPWIVAIFLALGVLLDFLTITELAGDLGETGTGEPSPVFFLVMIPWMILALVLLADLGFRSGNVGSNRFGPDPLQAQPS
jgi:uncharacterized membrane protein YhaH (DUF805 family)